MNFIQRIRRKRRQRKYWTPENLVECLRLFHDLVSQTPFAEKYWVCGGMLLGYARERKLLTSDNDFDFHYWSKDIDLFHEAINILEKVGFKKYLRWTNNEGHATEYVLIYKEIKFEFFEARRVPEGIHWYCYHHRPPRQFLNQVPDYELSPFMFYDREWLKPADHEQYLESLYGNWREPCPDYVYYEDSQAIIQTDPWTGGNQW
jgi:hypothetical protein